MADNPSESGYSQEYVEKLRKEAAEWRTKFRELENKSVTSELQAELAKRGIKADPSWVKINEGMSASDAVENFAAQYPHLVGQQTQENQPRAPRVEAPGNSSNSNLPTNPNQGRSLDEIKKDPVARSQLRDRYRQLIAQSSRQISSI